MTENTSSDAKAASFLLENYYYYAGQCLTAINRIRNDTKIVYIKCVCTVYIYYVNIKRYSIYFKNIYLYIIFI